MHAREAFYWPSYIPSPVFSLSCLLSSIYLVIAMRKVSNPVTSASLAIYVSPQTSGAGLMWPSSFIELSTYKDISNHLRDSLFGSKWHRLWRLSLSTPRSTHTSTSLLSSVVPCTAYVRHYLIIGLFLGSCFCLSCKLWITCGQEVCF